MADLTLAEAQDLIQVLKKILQSRKFFLPQSGQQVKLELASVFSDKRSFYRCRKPYWQNCKRQVYFIAALWQRQRTFTN